MNDRFRFRAWIPEYKRFIERQLIDGHEDPLEWEQCTGLKDKNGKLIYEGDIIQLTRERRWLPKGSLHIIEWRTFNCCGFCLGCLGSLTEKCSKECIVIGNIHENPELLEG